MQLYPFSDNPRTKEIIDEAHSRHAPYGKPDTRDRMPGEKKEQYKTGLEFISMDNKDKESLLSELKLYYE